MAHLTLEELSENFALFDDWEERYKYLIDLGKNLPPMDEAIKTEATIVKGCTSRVWMVANQDDAGGYHFTADSDAFIVKGLIAIVLSAYEGKCSAEIKDVNIEEAFTQIGLNQHLSPNRRNGFFAMVERVKALSKN